MLEKALTKMVSTDASEQSALTAILERIPDKTPTQEG
jgi:hypothetical protein